MRIHLYKYYLFILSGCLKTNDTDAYFIVRIPASELHFFLEFDRGLDQLRTIERKMAAYLFYH